MREKREGDPVGGGGGGGEEEEEEERGTSGVEQRFLKVCGF